MLICCSKASDFAEGKSRLHSKVEILSLLAAAAAGMGDEARSMFYIEKALETGSKGKDM